MSRPALIAAAAILLSGSIAPPAAVAAGFEILRPHRAVYDLRLKEASERSGIEAMSGRIAYEITGNECEGVAVRYRFVTDITTSEGGYSTDQRTSTFESADGKQFTFMTRAFVDGRHERTVRGTATRNAGGTVDVDLVEPAKRELALGDAVFISTHLVALLDAAEGGERFVRREVFDGSDSADEIVVTSAVIGEPVADLAVRKGEAAEAVTLLAGRTAWPVSVSYFETAMSAAAESLPVYEASFLLYENGVSRQLTMRYPDYALAGELTSLELLDRQDCSNNQ